MAKNKAASIRQQLLNLARERKENFDYVLKVYLIQRLLYRLGEKFQAMVMLDIANSRLKDFYDIWIISSKLTIEGQLLADAIKATFERRDTDMSKESLSIFEPAFYSDSNKQKQWEAFLRKNGLKSEMTFEQLMSRLESFITPAYKAARKSSNFDSNWLSDQWVQQTKS